MDPSDLKRRDFMKTAAATLAGGSLAAADAVPAEAPRFDSTRRMIGIQVGAVSFVDEGVQQVLDPFQERASLNTVFLAVFSYGRGIAARQVPRQLLPDHGRQEYDLSSDYVYQDTKWAADGLAGTKILNWPGIDVDIPTQPNHSKCTRQGVKAAVLAAFRAEAHEVVRSRKYSEMKLANLSGAGDAVRELKTG